MSGSKKVSIIGLDDKRQITAVFVVFLALYLNRYYSGYTGNQCHTFRLSIPLLLGI